MNRPGCRKYRYFTRRVNNILFKGFGHRLSHFILGKHPKMRYKLRIKCFANLIVKNK